MARQSALALACSGAALLWLALTLVVVVGRVGHDLRTRPSIASTPPGTRRVRRLVRRARRHKTELGRWRRAAALVELARSGSSRARPPILRAALGDADPEVRAAAVRALGVLAERAPWACELLVDALRREQAPRSRVAAELENIADVAPLLVPLLEDELPAVRYWAVLLLGRHPGVAEAALERAVLDRDAAVRRAAVESLGERGDRHALPAVLGRLDDEVMFVRAHACRAAGRLGGRRVARKLLPLLGDEAWWVRAAAKDTLRAMGPQVAPLLVQVLGSDDRFARNGAAEVLQDVGFVDELLRERPDHPLVERVFAAGEHGLSNAARLRASHQEPRADDGEVPVDAVAGKAAA